MLLADLERDRPSATKVAVRAMEQGHPGNQNEGSEPGADRMECIVGKFWLVGEHIDQRNYEQAGIRNRHQRLFANTFASICDWCLTSPPLMRIANNVVRYASKSPDEFGNEQSHQPALTIRSASWTISGRSRISHWYHARDEISQRKHFTQGNGLISCDDMQ